MFLLLGINNIVKLAMIKNKRLYEYIIIAGLDKIKFFGGIFGFIIIEMLGACIVIAIMFYF